MGTYCLVLLLRVKEQSEKAGLKLNIWKTKIMASGPITWWQIKGGKWKQWQIFFSWAPKSLGTVTAVMKTFTLQKESYDKPWQHIQKQRHHFANKGPYSQNYSYSSRHVWIWELDQKEGWAPKNWSFQIAVLEKTLKGPLDGKEINPEYSLEGLMLKLKL